MNKTTATIAGQEYTFQGVTDLEVMPLAQVFGTESPPEGTKEHAEWTKRFMQRFCEPSTQKAVALFLICAFPDIPEEIVKYTVRRLPDGTEECKPGRDLRVRLSANEFESIIQIISSELEKINNKSKSFKTKQIKPPHLAATTSEKSIAIPLDRLVYDPSTNELTNSSELRFNDKLELLDQQEKGLTDQQISFLFEAIKTGQIVPKTDQ